MGMNKENDEHDYGFMKDLDYFGLDGDPRDEFRILDCTGEGDRFKQQQIDVRDKLIIALGEVVMTAELVESPMSYRLARYSKEKLDKEFPDWRLIVTETKKALDK